MLDVIRHDPGHERLIRGVPAEFLRVYRRVPLHHPAQVARLGRPEQVAARLRGLSEDVGNDVHRVQQPALVIVAYPSQHVTGLACGPGIESRHGGPAGAGQPDNLAARVGGRAPPGDQAIGLESGQDAAQIARVYVDRAAQVGNLARVTLGQFEEQPRLGERVRGIQVLAAQQADHVRVEPVERPHCGYRCVSRGRARCVSRGRARQVFRRCCAPGDDQVVGAQFAHGNPNFVA